MSLLDGCCENYEHSECTFVPYISKQREIRLRTYIYLMYLQYMVKLSNKIYPDMYLSWDLGLRECHVFLKYRSSGHLEWIHHKIRISEGVKAIHVFGLYNKIVLFVTKHRCLESAVPLHTIKFCILHFE